MFTGFHLAICFLSQSTQHLHDSYLESSIRQSIGLPFFRVMFWRFILVLWCVHVSMFLCMPFNLLLRFGHLKKIDTFLRLYRLFLFRGSVQFSSVAQLCPTLCDLMNRQALLSITNSRSSHRLAFIKSVMPSSHFILCRPLLLLPPNPSQHQGLFQWVNSLHEVAKVLEFQL